VCPDKAESPPPERDWRHPGVGPTEIKDALSDFATVLAVVNPVMVSLQFITAVQHEPPATHARIALRAATIAAVILVVAIVIGQPLLEGLGVSLASFRIAGGMVLTLIGLRMILGEPRRPESPPETGRDVAVFPLAMPIISGPGAITAVILATDDYQYTIAQQAVTTVLVLLVLLSCYIAMRGAGWLSRLLGSVGVNVITRVMGLVLAALAVEVIIAGIKTQFGIVAR
jgi:multiple antibiotic resistance protein